MYFLTSSFQRDIESLSSFDRCFFPGFLLLIQVWFLIIILPLSEPCSGNSLTSFHHGRWQTNEACSTCMLMYSLRNTSVIHREVKEQVLFIFFVSFGPKHHQADYQIMYILYTLLYSLMFFFTHLTNMIFKNHYQGLKFVLTIHNFKCSVPLTSITFTTIN